MDNKTYFGKAFLKVWVDGKKVPLTNELLKTVKVEDIVPSFFINANKISEAEFLVENEYNGEKTYTLFLECSPIKAEYRKSEFSPTHNIVEDKYKGKIEQEKTINSF